MINITDYANLGADIEVLTFAAEKLGIDGVNLVVIKNDNILDKFESDRWFVNGLMHKTPVPNTYELILRSNPQDPLRLILCHEMIHLGQFVRGELTLDMDKKVFTWKGKKYTSATEYKSRPWEALAFNGQAGLLRAFRKSKKKPRKCIFKKSK